MGDANVALEAHGLSKRYGRATALRRVDLFVPSGVIAGLIGPNGAGKSTLLRTFLGFEQPNSGHVKVHGLDPRVDRRGVLGVVGYIPQAPVLYRNLTLAEHVQLVHELRPGFDRAQALRRLDDLSLPYERRAGTLSGGQRVQAYLALVLGLHAPVLLLDEPLASLDPLSRGEFLEVLREAVRTEGSTVVLSSHVVGDIERVCDYLVVLGDGRVTLNAYLEDALKRHWVVRAPKSGEALPGALGSYSFGKSDSVHLLAERRADAVPATLEDVVLGYLSAARPQQQRQS